MYTLLNASSAAKKFQLGVAGYERDEPNKFDAAYTPEILDTDKVSIKTAYVGNEGFHHRRNWTKKGGTLEVCGQVFLDTWLQKQYFLDGQDFNLVFKLNDPSVALHANDNDKKYKINIQKFYFYLRQVNVSPSVLLGHAKGMQKHNFVLP